MTNKAELREKELELFNQAIKLGLRYKDNPKSFTEFKGGIVEAEGWINQLENLFQSYCRESLERVRIGDNEWVAFVDAVESRLWEGAVTRGDARLKIIFDYIRSSSNKKIDTELKRVERLGGKQ